jgi:hypothetical protein
MTLLDAFWFYILAQKELKSNCLGKLNVILTFLNVHQLERQGADIQTKIKEVAELNQSLRQRDKVKDDAIAQLSDQLVSLSARLHEIERRQDIGAHEVMF